MAYGIEIADHVAELLVERAPGGSLSRLRSYLKHVALFAELKQEATVLASSRDEASGLFRWDFSGWTAYLKIDHAARKVRARGCDLTNAFRGTPSPERRRLGWSSSY